MSLASAAIDRDNLSCPHCHSSDVLQLCSVRSGVEYACDCCEHRWELDVDAEAETSAPSAEPADQHLSVD